MHLCQPFCSVHYFWDNSNKGCICPNLFVQSTTFDVRRRIKISNNNMCINHLSHFLSQSTIFVIRRVRIPEAMVSLSPLSFCLSVCLSLSLSLSPLSVCRSVSLSLSQPYDSVERTRVRLKPDANGCYPVQDE